MDRSADSPPPFFIVASARSGTTLLRVMLDRHPRLAIPPESHFIPRLWAERRRYGREGRIEDRDRFLRDLAADRRFQSWDLPIEAVRRDLDSTGRAAPAFPEAVAAAYRAYARARGKEWWGDKTPRHVNDLPLLGSLFPEARFVHMLRDGRDVALSVLELERLHHRAATPAYFWARHIRLARSAAQELGPARFAEVRYEDLLEDPEGELRRVCRFLGLGFEPVMLEHDRQALERIPARQQRMHARIALPPTKGLRDWRTQMSPADVAEFEAVAGRELVAAGYERAAAPPGLPVRARAWLRLGWFWLRSRRLRTRVQARRRRMRRDWAAAASASGGENRPQGPRTAGG